MKIVANIVNTRIEVSGTTQMIDNFICDSDYFKDKIQWTLKSPPPMDEFYTPRPFTAHAFLVAINEWKQLDQKHNGGFKVKILECTDVDPLPYELPLTGEPGDHMWVKALVDGKQVSISGATQQIATLEAEPYLYKHIRTRLRRPPLFAGTYGPPVDSAQAFISILDDWNMTGNHTAKLLEYQNVETIPWEPGVIY